MPGRSGSGETDMTSGGVRVSRMASVALDVSGQEPFNPKGEAHNLSQQWERWKQSFSLYTTEKVFRTMLKSKLLHQLPVWTFKKFTSTSLVSDGKDASFEASLQVLDNYFVPKSNIPFERHLFGQKIIVTGEWRKCVPVCVQIASTSSDL